MKPKISRPKGQVDTFKRALPVRKPQFSVMIWGAICAEWHGQFPFYIWDDTFEDADTKDANTIELRQENDHRHGIVDQARWRAQHVSKSTEARALQEINSNIQQENTYRRQIGQAGRLHQKTVQQVFPYDELKREHKKNGIDWFLYRQQILRPILYPFYFQVQEANSGKEIWLIEDRASPHQKAYNIERQFREEQGIRSCIAEGLIVEGESGWPGKSPDLNQIEPCWGDLKDECQPHWPGVRGATIAAKATACGILANAWRSIEGNCRNHAKGYLERLKNVESRDGNNNVRG